MRQIDKNEEYKEYDVICTKCKTLMYKSPCPEGGRVVCMYCGC